jgi:hypothetical protein
MLERLRVSVAPWWTGSHHAGAKTRRGGAVLVLALGLCITAVAPDALAQKPDAGQPSPQDVKKATTHFEKGNKLYEQKKYALALQEFKISYATVASPNSHLYIARCMALLGDTREAYLEFDKVVAEADERAKAPGGEKYAPTRDTAKTERDELLGKLALVTVDVKNADPAGRVTVGSVEIPASDWGKPVPVAPGETEVVYEPPAGAGGAPLKQSVALTAGDKKTVTLEAAAPTAPATPPPAAVEQTADSGSGGNPKLRPWAYVAGGVGAAGLVMFTVAGIMANSTFSDLEDSCGGPCPPDRQDDIDAGRTQQTLANVGLVVGVVGIGAGVTLFLLSRGGGASADAKTGQARIAPVVAPGYAGVRGAF